MDETKIQEVTEAEIVESPTPIKTETGNKMKVALMILAVGIVASGALYYVLQDRNNTVAVVNGFKITQAEFANSVSVITQNATLQGIDVTDPAVQSEINSQAVTILVNNALLIEGAKSAGIEVDTVKVQSEYDALLAEVGGETELKARMAEVGLSEGKLRSNISDRIIADAFIEAQTDIETLTVTEDEVESFLDSIQTEGTELPPLEEIRPQIEEQILKQKRQVIIDEFIASLRETADIDIKIEGMSETAG